MTDHKSNTIQGRMTRVSLPPSILDGFNVDSSISTAKILPGGAGTTYLVSPDNIVIKPAEDSIETELICDISSQLTASNSASKVLIPRPLRSKSGSYVFLGWSAFTYISNVRSLNKGKSEYTLERFKDILDASAALHAALRHTSLTQDQSEYLHNGCNHVWAHAHRAVWSNETDPQILLAPFAPAAAADSENWYVKLVRRLLNMSGKLCDAVAQNVELYSTASQIIHGDLVGGDNVLFPLQVADQQSDSDNSPSTPVIIDLSPTFGPQEYATGILLADGLIWCGAGRELIDLAGGPTPQRLDMIRRGVLFRCFSDIGLVEGGNDAAKPDIVEIERVTGLLEGWIRHLNASA